MFKAFVQRIIERFGTMSVVAIVFSLRALLGLLEMRTKFRFQAVAHGEFTATEDEKEARQAEIDQWQEIE